VTEEERQNAIERAVERVYVVNCEECHSPIDDDMFAWESDAEELAEKKLRDDGRVLCDDCHNAN
jgi:nitrate/TMAO reductase-like tetraheme cytochrome c subunit